MINQPTNNLNLPALVVSKAPSRFRRAWHSIQGRILSGLLFALPILITFWIVYWLYSTLELYIINPFAQLLLRQLLGLGPTTDLPQWFKQYAVPLIAILIVLLVLYFLGFFVKTRVRRVVDGALMRVPGISVVYNSVQKVFQTLDKQSQQRLPQRQVLIAFPHPGMKAPAFVTGTCRDLATQKVLVCVYVPTTPVPTSGYFLMVPEEEVTELNWTTEETLQAIISGGLTTPSEVRYYPSQMINAESDALAGSKNALSSTS